jgi:hypothetical protein
METPNLYVRRDGRRYDHSQANGASNGDGRRLLCSKRNKNGKSSMQLYQSLPVLLAGSSR